MKFQNFAVVFIIIVLPISLVLSVYTGNLITVANKQADYDAILLNSTYDSVRAYQMNTLHNSYESATNSKVRDINAAINSFFNSLAAGFSTSGLGKQELKDYIPAMLYTLYDGYYVYGAYDNIASVSDGIQYSTKYDISRKEYGLKPYIYYSCEYADKNGNYDLIVNYTLDNYITVTGSYRDINGIMRNIAQSGYYINYNNMQVNMQPDGNPARFSDKAVKLYPGKSNEVVIGPEKLGESIIAYDTKITKEYNRVNYNYLVVSETPKYFNYVLYNNIKYYLDVDHIGAEVVRDNTNNLSFNMTYDGYPIFFLDGDKRIYISRSTFDELKQFLGVAEDSDMYSSEEGVGCYRDVNAYYYYYRAVTFSKNVQPALELINLGLSDTTDENGNTVQVIASNIPYDENGNLDSKNVIKTETYHTRYTTTIDVESHVKSTYSNPKVFELNDENDPELEESSFNRHRLDVIISSIESSLVSTIANFNSYIGGTYDYVMPVLTEEDWYRICNNVTVASFMQGLTIGNYKYYSSYSIVANTKVKDFASKETIYLQDENENTEDYHNPRCYEYNAEITEKQKNGEDVKIRGYRNIEYDRQSCYVPSMEGTGGNGKNYYYYLQQNPLAYECIVSLNSNIYTTDELLNGTAQDKNPINPKIRKAYIEALAREKGNGYKTYGFLNEELQIK